MMESPPSCSTWSEAFILSDDSGLLLTSGSISSGSMSGHIALEYQNSEGEDKSLSQADSLEDMSDIMCGENFNTLKKGPNWNENEISCSKHTLAIEPPPEFQDKPQRSNHIEIPFWMNKYADQLVLTIIKDAMELCCRVTLNRNSVLYKSLPLQKQMYFTSKQYWNAEWLPFSPCHHNNTSVRPSSRSSLGSSRLSCSHNSLSIPATCKPDDSSFITQAVSHDTLTTNQISDLYNVPFDSDMYAVPVDVVVKPPLKPKRNAQPKKKRRNTSTNFQNDCGILEAGTHRPSVAKLKSSSHILKYTNDSVAGKRHSVPGSSLRQHVDEPIHMTLQEVRQYLQTLYSTSSESEHHQKEKHVRHKGAKSEQQSSHKVTNNNKQTRENVNSPNITMNGTNTNLNININNNKNKNRKNSFAISMKNKKVKDSYDIGSKRHISNNNIEVAKNMATSRRCPVKNFPSNLKQTLCNLFRFRRFVSPDTRTTSRNNSSHDEEFTYASSDLLMIHEHECRKGGPLAGRALPPLPGEDRGAAQPHGDFATSIEKVKDYGWYWGPISSEAAEKILSNEPDGSFIVRDSSDDHYIFSLTFKLNSGVRHVRIEHDQGNFSFGSCTKFKSHTIIEFIENAVEHSRSGRYLFFLHRRPVLGPMRVQLLHPVSRFKQTQSLQHMCRFVILKLVRKDLIPSLPLPRRIIDYLSTKHYYSEQFIESDENSGSNHESPQPIIEDTIRQS